MPSTTMLHVRVDEKIKARATKALSAMGLSISDAVRVLLTRVAAEKRLPFEIKVPNADTRAAMAETEDLLRGRRGRFRSADELFDDLAQDRGKSMDQILEEINNRARVLQYLVSKNMRNFVDIATILSQYHNDPQGVLSKIDTDGSALGS